MDSKKIIALFVVAVVLVGLGYFIVSGNKSNNPAGQNQQAQGTNEQINANQNPELSKRYIAYSPENLVKTTQNNGKAVLFFAALKWCPTCQAADRDFKANFDKLPKDVSILMVDYDTATELKNKYSITYQDTLVQVDGQGNEITRWSSGGHGVESLLANLK